MQVILYSYLSGALLGSAVIGTFVEMIPESVTNGLSVASGMLPALGIAILMQLLFNTKNAAFFFVGWVLTSLIGVNTVGAAVIGTTIAILFSSIQKMKKRRWRQQKGTAAVKCQMIWGVNYDE